MQTIHVSLLISSPLKMLVAFVVATVVLAGIVSGDPAQSCTNATCQQNGYCVQDQCHCDAGWKGDNCELLNFSPAPLGGAYGFSPNVTSWGGKPVFSKEDGLYHLFVAEIVGGCGLTEWGHNSRCVHATSHNISGPYKFHDVAVPVWCHGPEITVDVSGGKPKYLLFHIKTHPGKTPINCSYGSGEPAAAELRGSDPGGVSLHSSDSPYGPWQPEPALAASSNPSPVVFPNGSITVVDQWNVHKAPHFTGPWSSEPVQFHGDGGPGCTKHGKAWDCLGWEDPFVWFDQQYQVWKLIAHVWPAWAPDEPACDHDYSVRSAGYAWSYDAVHWQRSNIPPFDNKILREDGSTTVTSTRERPKLVLTADGKPMALFNGVSSNPPPWGCKIKPLVDATYTSFVPIVHKN